MRKTLLLVCIALSFIPSTHSAEVGESEAISLSTRGSSRGSSYGISKFNPLRPWLNSQEAKVNELRQVADKGNEKPLAQEQIASELTSPVFAPPAPPVLQTVPEPVAVPLHQIVREVKKTYFFERLPSIDNTADPLVPPNAFDEIDLVARGILTPDVSALVPDYLAAMAMQPQRSLFESISDRSLMHRRAGVQVALHQLLAGTIKNNQNLSASNYQLVQPTTWFGESMQRFDWEAFAESRPLEGLNDDSNDATYRISLNYSQVLNSFDENKKSKRPIIRADVRAADPKIVESLLRQLEAVATEYWTVVAERGKLVAATDQIEFCQRVLNEVESRRDAIPENVLALARTGFDRSTKVRSDALARLNSAQIRLANLVGDPMLCGDIEIQPKELPAGITLQSLEQEVELANTNRIDAKTSPEGVAMDVMLAHKRLGFALEESNRSFHAIHSVKANFEPATDNESAIQKLTTALELQDRLREATTQFLDAVVGQQRALIDMKRAKGTLARTEIFPASGRLPQILTPGQPGTENITPEQLTLRPQSAFSGDPLVPPPAVTRMENIPPEIARQIPGQITHIDGRPIAANQFPGRQQFEQPRPIPMHPPVAGPTASADQAQQPSKWSTAKRWLSKLTENQPLQRPSRR